MTTNIEPKSSVVSMRKYLDNKFQTLKETHENYLRIANDVNKNEDIMKDQFAAPLVTKANGLVDQLNGLIRHIRFIDSGGNVVPRPTPEAAPPQSIAMNGTIPSVTINIPH